MLLSGIHFLYCNTYYNHANIVINFGIENDFKTKTFQFKKSI